MKMRTKYVHAGKYVAEVDVELIESDGEWSPYLSVEDACMLDDVRASLRSGQIQEEAKKARVFELTPIKSGR